MVNRSMQQARRVYSSTLLILLGLLIFIMSGCSSPGPTVKQRYNTPGLAESSKNKPEQLVRIAKSMLGKPYRFGGNSPKTGFDCSGLVYYSHKRLGKSLPRTSSLQYKASRPVSKTNLKRGDLLFFRVYRRNISHVGIYLGNNQFVHAPSSGKEVSIAKLDSPYWSKRFVRGGRFF